MIITLDGYSCGVKITEEGLPSFHYWAGKNGTYRYGRSGIGEWVPPPRSKYEANATGRLTISLVGDYMSYGRQQSWSDRKHWSVEDKLPVLLLEIESRAIEARERERETQRQAVERQRAWEQAMERAREQFLEQRRASVLNDQVERWQRANEIRAYCAVVEDTYRDANGVAEWVAWARRYSDRIDPLQQPAQMPDDPERISPEDLKPFLGGWSPYGPNGW